MTVLQVGTYRTVSGELLHYRLDPAGAPRCEIERADGSRRPGCEICDCGVMLSDDPDWPWRDPLVPSLVFVD